MTSRLWIEVNLSRLKDNLSLIKGRIRSTTGIIAVIKANAYGHGLLPVARALMDAGVTGFAAVGVEEAVRLREDGCQLPILLLEQVLPADVDAVVHQRLTAAVSDLLFVKTLDAASAHQHRQAKVHLRIDVGMGSNGSLPEQSLALAQRITALPNLALTGIFTHLNAAYGGDLQHARIQLNTFDQVLRRLAENNIQAPYLHAASSPALFLMPEAEYNLIRPGIALYGLPCGNSLLDGDIRPVMSIKSRVGSIKTVDSSFRGGYGWSFETTRETRIATLPIGYADLFFYHYVRSGYVLIHGRKAPILGNVCMNHLMVDVTAIPEACPSDEAVLLGIQDHSEIRAADLAEMTGINHDNLDLVCLLPNAIPRVYTA
ncbi:MAG: alanine racemase [Solirubrobacterales bacterium]